MNINALLAFLITLFILSGCHSSNRESTQPGNTSSLTLTGDTDNNESNHTTPIKSLSTETTLQIGDIFQLKFQIDYDDGHSEVVQDVIYSSDNPQIASVDSDGFIYALSPGNTIIHATYGESEALLKVTVTPLAPPSPLSLSISSPFTEVEAGKTETLQAILQMSDETTQDVTTDVAWQSEDNTICSIDQNGILNTLQSGECIIHAQYQNNPKLDATFTFTITSPTTKIIYECPATQESEAQYQSTFIDENFSDINYDNDLMFEKLTVTQIEALFNHAREIDPTVNEPMVLPPQEIWDSYDASQKTLYLVNAARCARGIRPLEGIDPTLRDEVTKPYTLFLTTHESEFLQNPHSADGKSPAERMADADIVLGDTSEYYGENIAMFTIRRSDYAQSIDEAEARSVYAWLYQDKEENYGHRETLLQTGLQENSGAPGKEGLFAAHTAQIEYTDEQGFYVTKTYTVMDFFDPTAKWSTNMDQMIQVPLYMSLNP